MVLDVYVSCLFPIPVYVPDSMYLYVTVLLVEGQGAAPLIYVHETNNKSKEKYEV